jgi:arylformamidase
MDTYRGMDRKALDRAYNNVAAVPDIADTVPDFARRGAAIYTGVKQDLAYGKAASQRIDWIPGPTVQRSRLRFGHFLTKAMEAP